MIRAAIGVDIGGGSVKLGLVTEQGKLVVRESFLTPHSLGREGLLDILSAHIGELGKLARKRGFKLLGAGIGAPGPIDVERGFVYFFPNIPGWKDTPLRSLLEKRLKMPVRVDNDANAMALAEVYFGAGRGAKNVIALTLGTGVGGGLLIDGKLFHGPSYSAAEIGHLVINEDGPACGCGNHGCIETYVGTSHFARAVRKRLDSGEKSILKKWIKEGKELSPFLVGEAARKGDVFAKRMWKIVGGHLGTALVGLVNILNPERVIIGGGIAQNGELLFRPLRETLSKKAFPIAARSVRVVPAKLGVDAGVIGAAALIFAARS